MVGDEAFLTLAGGHFAAFCRAALNRCATPEPKLQDHENKIDVAKLRRDKAFAEMLDKGWEYTKISWEAEERYPKLCAFIQRAMNASNTVACDASELEVM